MSEREKLVLEGLTVAPNVIDTIVRLATEKVEGVAAVGSPTSIRSKSQKPIDVQTDENGRLLLDVHVQAYYGTKLHELGAAIQSAIADALTVQVGVAPESVNVFIDALIFAE